MLDLLWVTLWQNLPSCLNSIVDWEYLDYDEYASSLLLEHRHTLHHHPLPTHSLQGLPP